MAFKVRLTSTAIVPKRRWDMLSSELNEGRMAAITVIKMTIPASGDTGRSAQWGRRRAMRPASMARGKCTFLPPGFIEWFMPTGGKHFWK
jgi:hypothetical protein